MTIKDLAEKTGYGVATISRVLNNQPNVSEKARRIVLEAAEECGFQINVNARQLKQQHPAGILVMVKGTGNELFGELVEAIQSHIADTEYPLSVDYMDEEANEVRRAIQLSREKKPLGILFLGGNRRNFLADFGKVHVPCVLITNDASDLPFPNLSSVFADDRQAARCAMNTLIAQGHQRIVIVGGDREASDTSRLRYEGCLEAVRANGLDFDEARDYRGVRYSYWDGYNATRELLAAGHRFTALFAVADVMAIGAIRALWEAGLRVPEDVSVVGFDGLPLGSFLVPQLTTVAQPVQQMARHGVDILLECIRGGIARHEKVAFSLLQRESTRQL